MSTTRRILTMLASSLLVITLIPHEAFAGPPRGRSISRGGSSARVRSFSSRSSGLRSSSSRSSMNRSRSIRSTGSLNSGRNTSRSGRSGSSNPFSSQGGNRNSSWGGLGNGSGISGLADLMGLYGSRGGYWGDRYSDPHKEYADAYRDAAIANAVVGLVGVLVNASVASQACQTQQVVSQPVVSQPVAVQPAAPPQRSGHYQTQRTLVREGHYVKEEVWVPEYYDESRGVWIEGHTQVQKRWAPPVWQEQQVWVPGP